MKTQMTFFLICIFSFAQGGNSEIRILNSGNPNKFIFQADRDLIGSEVLITDSDGTFVSKFTIKRKRVVIDFCKVKEGAYDIKIASGVTHKEFTFSRGQSKEM